MTCLTCRYCCTERGRHAEWKACGHPDAPVTYIPDPESFGCTFHEPTPGQLDLWGAA